jgi:hypothetical protein
VIDRAGLRAAVDAAARRAWLDGDPRALVAVGLLYPAWQAVVRAGRAADRALAPGFARRRPVGPVFVVGHPRSGTTWLHRLLALDPRFTAPRAWQLALPSVSAQRAVRAADALGLARPLAAALQRRLLDPLADRHAVRWSDPEEDDWLFLHGAASPTVSFLSGRPEAHRRWWLGDALPAAERDRALRWYLRSAQRHLHTAPPGATLLSKNPHFTGWLRTLDATFPDARFVLATRRPADAIASRLELLARAWGRRRLRDDPDLLAEVELSVALIRHGEAAFSALPEARRARVPYDALVADPVGTLRGLYAHFGWDVSSSLAGAWAQAAAEARRRVLRAPVRLRSFGLRDRDVHARLADLVGLWDALGQRP